ncbi:MAG TPA: hypothetical protein VFQ47_02080 [Nitrososphaera sp.]|nr:hypothetical protein [Nitrososphaera sp.]
MERKYELHRSFGGSSEIKKDIGMGLILYILSVRILLCVGTEQQSHLNRTVIVELKLTNK